MQSPQSNICKTGNLKRLKTLKRKHFVLREDSNQAYLEYHDTEKKFQSGGRPKRSIVLQKCFSINEKSDPRHKHAIVLFTKDDCFGVVCDTDEQQREWLAVMLDLRNKNSTEPTKLFEHIWPVTVKPKGLGNSRLTPGVYRLCLTNKELSLIRLAHEEPDLVFQLASIRRCGHTDCFFFLELGRQSVTGAGELWMQVEDTVIAQNMHEAILSSMKTSSLSTAEQPTQFRPRSQSSITKPSKPVKMPCRPGPGGAAEFSTLPKRSKTMSGGERPSSPLRRRHSQSPSKALGSTGSTLRPVTITGYGQGHSPLSCSPVSFTLADPRGFSMTLSGDGHRSRTDSMESHGSRRTDSSMSADELDSFPEALSSVCPFSSSQCFTPEGLAADGFSEYLPMTPGSREVSISPIRENISPGQDGGYMDMAHERPSVTARVTLPPSDYQKMSPGIHCDESAYFDMNRTKSSASPAMSSTTASSGHEDGEEVPYCDMSHMTHSPCLMHDSSADAGYLDMSPGSCSPSPFSTMRPEKVHSYLSDDSHSDDFPKRAYSVGSRAAVLSQGKPLNESYMDMGAKSHSADKVNAKCLSTPHLDKDKLVAGPCVSGVQSSCSSRRSSRDEASGLSDLLMELDFHHKRSDSLEECNDIRPRAASGGARDFRPRTSSYGQQDRRRTCSFGARDAPLVRYATLARAVESCRQADEGRRPRTCTVCEDPVRPRTASFGAAVDMRPRSSSYGNARFRELKHCHDSHPNVTSSHESLKRPKGSQDSINSTSSDYLDMNPRKVSSPSQALTAALKTASKQPATKSRDENSYVSMEAGQRHTSSLDYINMNTATAHPRKGAERMFSKSRSSKNKEATVKLSSSSTESLSSSSQGSDAKIKVRQDHIDEESENNGGEYVDLGFGERDRGSKVKGVGKTVNNDDSGDSYIVYSRSDSRESSPMTVHLDKVSSPIRMGEEVVLDDGPKVAKGKQDGSEPMDTQEDSYVVYSPDTAPHEPSPLAGHLEKVSSPICAGEDSPSLAKAPPQPLAPCAASSLSPSSAPAEKTSGSSYINIAYGRRDTVTNAGQTTSTAAKPSHVAHEHNSASRPPHSKAPASGAKPRGGGTTSDYMVLGKGMQPEEERKESKDAVSSVHRPTGRPAVPRVLISARPALPQLVTSAPPRAAPAADTSEYMDLSLGTSSASSGTSAALQVGTPSSHQNPAVRAGSAAKATPVQPAACSDYMDVTICSTGTGGKGPARTISLTVQPSADLSLRPQAEAGSAQQSEPHPQRTTAGCKDGSGESTATLIFPVKPVPHRPLSPQAPVPAIDTTLRVSSISSSKAPPLPTGAATSGKADGGVCPIPSRGSSASVGSAGGPVSPQTPPPHFVSADAAKTSAASASPLAPTMFSLSEFGEESSSAQRLPSGSPSPAVAHHHQLNYATLDLQNNPDDGFASSGGSSRAAPISPRSPHSSGSSEKAESPLQYAQIDFSKSEEMQQSAKPKTTKPPFEL